MDVPVGKKLSFQEFQSNQLSCHLSSNQHDSQGDFVLQCLIIEFKVSLWHLLVSFSHGQFNVSCFGEGSLQDLFVSAITQKTTNVVYTKSPTFFLQHVN